MEHPKRRDADRSRVAILDAAEALFAEHGFASVTMAQIGAAAGVSRGTPGYFFGTKEALHGIVVGRAAATLRMLAETLRVRDAAGDRPPADRLGETVDAFLSLLTSRASLVRLIDRQNGVASSGEPHAEALRDALDGLGPERDRVALIALAMCWFPLSQPDAARVLGVDPAAPGFAGSWRHEVVAAIGRLGSRSDPETVSPPSVTSPPGLATPDGERSDLSARPMSAPAPPDPVPSTPEPSPAPATPGTTSDPPMAAAAREVVRPSSGLTATPEADSGLSDSTAAKKKKKKKKRKPT